MTDTTTPLTASPLTLDSVTAKALHVPAEMILQVASGLEDPAVIAGRFGFEPAEWKQLEAWPPFVQQVGRIREEMKSTGLDFVLDARLKAKELSDTLFVRALQADTSFGQLHETMKTFAELGDLKPKKDVSVAGAGGAGFSIQINFGPPPSQPQPTHQVIDVTPHPEPLAEDNPFVLPEPK
jgi:hypothetical protein